MKGSPILQINALYPDLHTGEKKIADTILSDPIKIINLSVKDLALLTESSESSIVRFCKLLGYSGYSQLKLELAIYAKEYPSNLHYESVEATQSVECITKRVLENDANSLSKMALYLSSTEIEQAVDAILNAKLLYLCGYAYSGQLAMTFQSRLKGLGIPSILSWDPLSMKHDILTLAEGDLVFAISQSGSNKNSIAVAQAAKERGAKVLALTTSSDSALCQYADFKIIVPFFSNRVFERYLSTEIIFHSILNSLYVILDSRQNPDKKEAFETFFKDIIKESIITE